VRKIEMANCFRYMPWFFGIELSWLTFADSTEATMSRADITTQHESRGAIRPAFKNIRTSSFLADSMQIQPVNEVEYMILVRRITQTYLQPFGLGLPWLAIADYLEFARQILFLS